MNIHLNTNLKYYKFYRRIMIICYLHKQQKLLNILMWLNFLFIFFYLFKILKQIIKLK